MKKGVIFGILVIVVGLAAYNYFTTGKLTLIPSSSVSAEASELKDLGARFNAAKRQFAAAGRAAALSGVDSTADAEAAMLEIEQVEARLSKLKRRLGSDPARRDAERLERTIREFKRDLS